MPNVANVTAGKPKVAGHVFRAPIGSTIPNDATTALDNAFIDLGYISEDGLTNANTPETETIRAWGGTPVLHTVTSKDDTFTATFISSLNAEVLKMVYGDDNVTGTDVASGISVSANSKDLPEYIYVIEMIAKGNVAHRIVIPSAKPTEIGEVSYTDSEAVGYEVTLGCSADASGNTHYEYFRTN